MPRIVAGRLKGRNMRVPRNVTRPTSSRVREALFDLLSHSPELSGNGPDWWNGGRIADLYAGSGAMGFEASSRGAGQVTFVESDGRACAVIRENMRELGLERTCRVIRGRLPGAVARLVGEYDLVFMDPPYRRWRGAGDVASGLAEGGLLARGALLVLEVPAKDVFQGRRASWPDWADNGSMDPVLARRWGDTGVVIFRFLGYRAKVGIDEQ